MEDEIIFSESRVRTRTKVIVTVVFFLLIIGAMIFFFKSNNFDIKKTVTYEIGDKLSLDVTDYIINKPFNEKDYKLVVDSVRYDDGYILDTVGEYTYRVVLKDIIKEGKIIVKDTKGPVVDTMNITIGTNESYKADDFVTKCIDYSLPCEYEIEGKVDTSKAGNYDLKLKSKDSQGNTTTSNIKLTVKDGYSLKEEKVKDLTPKYLEPSYSDWNGQYVVKYAGGLDPDDEDNPRWKYYYDFLEDDPENYLDSSYKGKSIEKTEIIAVYNQYHFIIGFACRAKLTDGTYIYLTNGE